MLYQLQTCHKSRVAFYSLLILIVFSAFLLAAPELSGQTLGIVRSWIGETFGWFYMVSVTGFILSLLYCGFSRAGDIKLGKEYDKPAFSRFSWSSMLFCTGMGIGLVFFGVAEPVMHYMSPPVGEGQTAEAAQAAMRITFFHWGINAWAIYATVGLAISYMVYRRGRAIEMRSILYSLIGEKANGRIGDVVDTFAVCATVMGIVTPLGFGVMQMNAGLNYLFGVEVGLGTQLTLIAVIALVTFISLTSGLKRGIKRLSEFNIVLALSIMLFVFFAVDSSSVLNGMVDNIGVYLANVAPMSLNTYTDSNPDWFQGWTLFYWAWWIAFAAPTGIFIARISKGRTLREFVFGVMFIPVGLSFVWLSIFGNSALDLIHNQGMESLGVAVMADSSTALFKFFELLTDFKLVSYAALLCILVFFITTADSGTMVVSILTSTKEEEAPIWQRAFWVVLECALAAALLIAGGLSAIQSALVILGFPFAIIMCLMTVSLLKEVRADLSEQSFDVISVTVQG